MIQEEIEKTLASLDTIKRAEANPFLYQKIAYRLKEQGRVGHRRGSLVLRLGAICAALIVINVVSWIGLNRQAHVQNISPMEQLYGDYVASGQTPNY